MNVSAIATVDNTVYPSTLNVVRSVVLAGGLADVLHDDANRLHVRAGIALNAQDSPVQLAFTGNGFDPLNGNASTFVVRLKSQASTPNIEQKIQAYNWQTLSMETLDVRTVNASENDLRVTVSMNARRFLSLADKSIVTLVTYRQVGPVTGVPWSVKVNVMNWITNP